MRQRHQPDAGVKSEGGGPLENILTAGRLIVAWTDDVNEHRLWSDKQMRAAVERQFEVIGAALARLREIDPRSLHSLTDADAAIRLGQAIHREYDNIDYGILWRGARKELPQMLQQVEDLLATLGA